MKSHLDIKHDGNLSAEGRTAMSLDENSLAHLMSILIDLYSDQELAVIREYTANAMDSHVAAGVTRPVKVTLPSSLNPVFTVQDFGTGMSLDDILNYFGKYGASSKRHTDDEVGMLGLGSKSALTYTSQFSLVATKGGVKVTVLITRLESGAGAVQIMDTTTTDEPNGVIVQVPVKYVDGFNNRAREFYSYWDQGTIEVDGRTPLSVWANPKNICLDPDIMLVPGYGRTSQIVMGNIAYPVNHYEAGDLIDSEGLSVVVRVPIGSVNFVPNREALQYTKRTKEVIRTIQEYVENAVLHRAQADVNACATHYEALVRATEWRKAHAGLYRLEYRGQTVPTSFPVPNGYSYRWNVNTYEEESSVKEHYVDVDEAINQWHVVNFKAPYVTKATKRKLKIHYNERLSVGTNGIDAKIHHFHRGEFGGPWLVGRPNLIDASEIEAIELPVIAGEKPLPRTKGKYRLLSPAWNKNTYDWTDELPENVLWCLADQAEGRRNHIACQMNEYGFKVVAIPRKDAKKFLAANPGIKHVATWVADQCREFGRSLTEYECYAYHRGTTIEESGIKKLNGSEVLDPELRAVLALARMIPSRGDVHGRKQRLDSLARTWRKRVPPVPVADRIDKIIWAAVKPYPILTHGSINGYGRGDRTPRVDAKGAVTDIVNAQYLIRTQLHLNPITY